MHYGERFDKVSLVKQKVSHTSHYGRKIHGGTEGPSRVEWGGGETNPLGVASEEKGKETACQRPKGSCNFHTSETFRALNIRTLSDPVPVWWWWWCLSRSPAVNFYVFFFLNLPTQNRAWTTSFARAAETAKIVPVAKRPVATAGQQRSERLRHKTLVSKGHLVLIFAWVPREMIVSAGRTPPPHPIRIPHTRTRTPPTVAVAGVNRAVRWRIPRG